MQKQIWKVVTFFAALVTASSAAAQTNHGEIPSRSVLQILLKSGQNHCASCSVPLSRAILIESAKLGRIARTVPRLRPCGPLPNADKLPHARRGSQRTNQTGSVSNSIHRGSAQTRQT